MALFKPSLVFASNLSLKALRKKAKQTTCVIDVKWRSFCWGSVSMRQTEGSDGQKETKMMCGEEVSRMKTAARDGAVSWNGMKETNRRWGTDHRDNRAETS